MNETYSMAGSGASPVRPIIAEPANAICDDHLTQLNRTISEIEYRIKDRTERLDNLNFEQGRDNDLYNVLLKARNAMQTFFDGAGEAAPKSIR